MFLDVALQNTIRGIVVSIVVLIILSLLLKRDEVANKTYNEDESAQGAKHRNKPGSENNLLSSARDNVWSGIWTAECYTF